MSSLALMFAATMTGVASVIHSWLGERQVIGPLLRPDQRSGLIAERPSTRRVLRLSWHLLSIAWLGLGAILVALALAPPELLGDLTLAIATAVFWLNGLTFFLALGIRHIAWPLFIAAAAAASLAFI